MKTTKFFSRCLGSWILALLILFSIGIVFPDLDRLLFKIALLVTNAALGAWVVEEFM